MPATCTRVVCGLLDVMLTRAPTSAFMSVDLPTLGRPTIATRPERNGRLGAGFRLAPDDAVIGFCSSGLLGRAATRAGAARRDRQRRNAAFDLEGLGVGVAANFGDRVLGNRDLAPLQELL